MSGVHVRQSRATHLLSTRRTADVDLSTHARMGVAGQGGAGGPRSDP